MESKKSRMKIGNLILPIFLTVSLYSAEGQQRSQNRQSQTKTQQVQPLFVYRDPTLFVNAVKVNMEKKDYGLAYYLILQNENNTWGKPNDPDTAYRKASVEAFLEITKPKILEKVKLEPTTNFSVCIPQFKNYTREQGLSEHFQSAIAHYFIENTKARVYEGENPNCDVFISGSINIFSISESKTERTEPRYRKATNFIPNPEYDTARTEMLQICARATEAEARAAEKAGQRGTSAFVNFLYGAAKKSETHLWEAGKDALGAMTAADEENVGNLKRKCEEAKWKLNNTKPHIAQDITEIERYVRIFDVKKEGQLQVSVMAKNDYGWIFFAKKITEYYAAYDTYSDEEHPSITGNEQIALNLVEATIKKLEKEMKEISKNLSISKLCEEMRKSGNNRIKKASIEGIIKAIEDKYSYKINCFY